MKTSLEKLKESWRAAFVARGIFEAAGVLLFAMAVIVLIFWYAIIARDQSMALIVSGIFVLCAIAMFYLASMMEERGERLYKQYKLFEKFQASDVRTDSASAPNRI